MAEPYELLRFVHPLIKGSDGTTLVARTRRKKPATLRNPKIQKLTYKQRLFVFHFLGVSNGNATDAARRSGYAWPDKVAERIVGKSGVRAAINAAIASVAMSAEEVLARLSEIAAADMGEFLSITEAGLPVVNLNAARKAGKLHLIRKIRPTADGAVLIEVHDPLRALEKLGRYYGLFDDRIASAQREQVAESVQALRDHLRSGRDEPIVEQRT